ncbi:hypothetical protein L915_22009 [Phytophthora nicotianae]|uniref:Uncharacterized protein n=1 Tax=Phytophthora nicotianae TaxID=4792 RepID=W2HQQ4_PHYNI|nr:hypothetical protein L915_22009 [Phytophthora nicotianae]ETL24314.1 hypothetical protein L916_21673 [Phytophthora nicotianae]
MQSKGLILLLYDHVEYISSLSYAVLRAFTGFLDVLDPDAGAVLRPVVADVVYGGLVELVQGAQQLSVAVSQLFGW